MKCPTRGENRLDHVYTNIKQAYRAIPLPHLGLSDHISLLTPAYTPLRRKTSPHKVTIKTWGCIFFSFRIVLQTLSRAYFNIRTWVYTLKLFCPTLSSLLVMTLWTNAYGSSLTRSPGWPARSAHSSETVTLPSGQATELCTALQELNWREESKKQRGSRRRE